MRAERLSTADDPRLRLFNGVRDPELLAVHGLFVAESRAVIARALALPDLHCRGLLLTEAAGSALGAFSGGCPTYVAPREVMTALAGYRVHQGALALFERPRPMSPGE